jgi:hypothetical protein
MAGGADRIAAARGSCPAIDSGQRRAAGHRLEPPRARGPSGCAGGGGGSGDNRCAPVENGSGSSAGVGSAALSCGSGGPKSTVGLRGAGQSAAGDRLLRTRPPKLWPQGVVPVGHRKFLLQRSDDANVGRSQVSTIPHQDTPNLGLPAACPLFGGGKTPATVPIFDYWVGDLHACQWLEWGCVVGADGDS